jgi:opacity protein-like surface antigen
MKLRYLAAVVCFALTTFAAHAQIGVYMNPIAIHASNSVQDTGPFNFYDLNSKSRWLAGFNLGAYDDFFHSGGALNAGVDARFTDVHGGNAMLRSFMLGVRVSGQMTSRPIRPYVQASIGLGTTKSPESTVHVSKGIYGIFVGADYSFAKHVDFRVAELGYGSATTVSSATVGAGGNIAIPAAKLVTVSSGLVFRF